MEPRIRDAERRAYRYWYEDGLIDILLGMFLLLVGATSVLEEVPLPEGLAIAAGVVRIVVVVVAALVLRRIVRRLKERVTYPRTGYVAYRRRPGWLRWLKVGTGVTAGAIIGLLSVSQSGVVQWLPVLAGTLIGAALLYAGVRFDLTRYHALALVSVLAGGVAAWLALSSTLRLALLLGIVGLAAVVAGVVTLIGYLRRNPRQEGDL